VARRLSARAAELAVTTAFAWLVAVWLTHRVVGGDTPYLVDGTDALARCLSRGDLVGCGFTGKLNAAGQMSPIGPYPLMQYIPDFVARSVGATHDTRYTVLAVLSLLGVAASAAVAWLTLAHVGLRAWIWGFLILVLSGPILVYANTTWGEMLATGLLTALVATALLRAPTLVIAAAGFGASLAKETSYPFVAALGTIGLVLAARRLRKPIRAHLIALVVGIVLAAVCASLFNVVRFGGPENTNYLRPEFRSPIARVPELALGLFVAPNGGILIFWTSATVLVGALLTVPLLRPSGYGSRRFRTSIALPLAAICMGLTVSLAFWWAPFGWAAWGPRLSLPWVLPLALLGLTAFGKPVGVLLAALLESRTRMGMLALAIVLTTLPHIGYLWHPSAASTFFNRSLENEDCSAPGPLGSPSYYRCLHEEMWSRRSIMNDALSGLGDPGGIATTALVAMGILGCIVLLRRELSVSERGVATPSSAARAGPVTPPRP
jgi:hypothetical protein